MKVKLEEVIDAIMNANNDIEYYYSIESEEVISIFTFDYDQEAEEIRSDYDDKYIMLPEKYEINDYGIMKEFIYQIEDSYIQNKLFDAINQKGAFRKFKDTVLYFNIEKSWYKFRDDEYRRFAIEWCQENEIEIEE